MGPKKRTRRGKQRPARDVAGRTLSDAEAHPSTQQPESQDEQQKNDATESVLSAIAAGEYLFQTRDAFDVSRSNTAQLPKHHVLPIPSHLSLNTASRYLAGQIHA